MRQRERERERKKQAGLFSERSYIYYYWEAGDFLNHM
jgi:hypothetical protein